MNTSTPLARLRFVTLQLFRRQEHDRFRGDTIPFAFRAGLLAWMVFTWVAAHAADWSILRGGDGKAAAAAVRSGVDLNAWDADGNPALLVAALHGSADAVRVLLEAGADVNATNRAGATALIYAVSDPAKVKLLLRRKAEPNRSSLHGTTPLIAAAGSPNGYSSASYLVAAGANVHATNRFGVNALWRASYAGNTAIVRLLLKHGANPGVRPVFPTIEGELAPGPAPLHNAAFRGETKMIKVLLGAGADLNAVEPFAGNALHNALYGNHPQAAVLLVNQGINLETPGAHGQVPAMVWAGYSDVGDTTVAKILLARQVPVDAKNESGETVLTWARKRGTNALVSLLASRGAPEGVRRKEKAIPANEVPEPGTSAWMAKVRDAIQRSVDALEVTSSAFLDSNLAKRDNCVTCHQQTVPAVAFGQAQRHGFKLDASVLKKQLDAQLASWMPSSANAYELDEPQPDAPVNLGWGLYGLATMGYKSDALTDAMVWYLAAVQEKDGSWRCDDFRPPMEDGSIVATALALHALQLYPIRGREKEMAARINRAADWLSKVEAGTPSRRAFQLLGLGWSGSHEGTQKRLAETVLKEQRPDGGWSQLPGLESDAWATAEALTALRQSKAVSADDSVYRKGASFLLRTQFADGSWFVRSRTWPFQPHFDSSFPHGKDQWISAASTAWATVVLLDALDDAPGQKSVALMSPER